MARLGDFLPHTSPPRVVKDRPCLQQEAEHLADAVTVDIRRQDGVHRDNTSPTWSSSKKKSYEAAGVATAHAAAAATSAIFAAI